MTHLDNQEQGVSRIARVSLSVEDLDAARRFYAEALGFSTTGRETRRGEAFAALTGLSGAHATAAAMRLGAQTLELVEFTAKGESYPDPRAANDPWFQHFAIAVSDMDQAFAKLALFPFEPISQGGPQRLPPRTGDVTAYKFRDPGGHPLELSYAPGSPWTDVTAAQPTLGIDHSALAVADLDVSVAFYTQALSFRLGPLSLNQGPEQGRLDGLDDPVVDIAILTTRDAGPHLELLHYRTPKSSEPPRPIAVNDIAATRLVLDADNLDLVAERALAAGGSSVSDGIVVVSKGRTLMLRDPDGHLLELVESHD
jgi:catechol 2,3-dioxygenase-like lactoylglutathione lyase family enzyme